MYDIIIDYGIQSQKLHFINCNAHGGVQACSSFAGYALQFSSKYSEQRERVGLELWLHNCLVFCVVLSFLTSV